MFDMNTKFINIILGLATLLTLGSCKKTLELDYDTVPRKLVIEGSVSNEEIKVFVTRTSNMTDTLDKTPVTTAQIEITGSDGYDEFLEAGEDGYYYSPKQAIGKAGVTYTLKLTENDTVCTAQSTMPNPIELDSAVFSWLPIMSDIEIRICNIYWKDPADESNYYLLNLYRNGELFKSNINDDSGMTGEVANMMLSIMSRNEWEDAEKKKKAGDDKIKEDIIYNGDTLVFDVRAIDLPTYLYYNSMSYNESSAINPTSNIKGDGCLGVFSAYYSSKRNMIYRGE